MKRKQIEIERYFKHLKPKLTFVSMCLFLISLNILCFICEKIYFLYLDFKDVFSVILKFYSRGLNHFCFATTFFSSKVGFYICF